MRRVVVDMQNALFADAISSALKNFDSDFSVYQSEASGANNRDVFRYTGECPDYGGHRLYSVEA